VTYIGIDEHVCVFSYLRSREENQKIKAFEIPQLFQIKL
jgi:hypothetical protein